ncbi:PHD finger protein 24 [Bagarius yarrelli]|uniref:PHD finger protein 24 n=1 Tax=Bagarius yarrelli TaxID=175774 RepID=A0A556U2L9_BAGYA|nr:PHD finger protein 24 [Bagarius yarrelli]
MGVLMSKKQQVEKVQKCSVVVSAFRDGLKNQPSANQVQNNCESKDELQNPPESDDSGRKEEDGKPGPSTAQPKEENKANQEAWNRLRDGKGVEPEELNKVHQLTPPAFIRPKRRSDDDQPIQIELGQREQLIKADSREVTGSTVADENSPQCGFVYRAAFSVEKQKRRVPVNDEMCEVCEVWTADDLFPCRTCTRVFHDGCLKEIGYLRADTVQEMRETAHTTVGWSCYYCVRKSCLVSDELLQYRHFVSKQLFEKDLTDDQEEEVLAQFAALDPEKKGQIEWSDFLYHESLSVLQKFRTENSLVRLLTAKERDRARAVFQSLDQDKNGVITAGESRRAQTSWFRKHSKEPQSCNVSHVGPISESSPASSSSDRSRDKAMEKYDNRLVTWDTFLRESAIYILAARPNSSAMHIRLPL